MKVRASIAVLATAATLGVAGCGSATVSGTASSNASAMASSAAAPSGSSSPSNGVPPSGQPSGAPGGAPPGGGSTTQTTPLGAYTVSSGSQTSSGKSYSASAQNTSGVLVTGGSLTLSDATVTTTGNTSSNDESSFYGLNAGVLVKNATATITGGSVTTSGSGANDVFAYGKAVVAISNTTLSATGGGGHGIMASGGGTVTATNLTASTTGKNGAVIATDRGGGTINVIGGTYTTAGADSPGIYSTGAINVRNATVTATGAEAMVIEGANSITTTNTTLTGETKNGVMIYQSMSGDAQGNAGVLTMTGGSLTNTAGATFFVTNTTATVKLTGVTVNDQSGTLVKAAAAQWGNSGSNGGALTLTASKESLGGNVLIDKVSSVSLALMNGSTWTGAFDAANTAKSSTLTLDAASRWVVTGTSYVGTLKGLTISGSTVTNITGNGHTVYYDAALNSSLGGKTYTLAGGGTLKPAS